MDMSRDFFKKIRDTKRKYNEKMGTKKVLMTRMVNDQGHTMMV